MTKTLAQINARLAEIAKEQAELATIDHDSLLAQAIVTGADVDQVEADQAAAERRAKRLRIEHDTLTAMIPEAKRVEVGPQIEQMIEQHAELMKAAGKASAAAVALWQKLQAELNNYGDVRAKAINLTNQARTLAGEVDAPLPMMGSPLSASLKAIAWPMERAGKQLNESAASRATLVMADCQFEHQGVDVDVSLKGAA